MPTIYQIVIIALIAAFIVLTTTKSQIRYQLIDFFVKKKINIFVELLECDFCFGFWTALAVSIIFALFTLDFRYLFTPIFASPLIRFII